MPVHVSPTTSSAPRATCTSADVVKEGGFGKFMHRREPTADRRPDRHPAEPRHALLGGRVRPRCGAGDHHAARCRQALHVDAGDRRGPVHARGRLRRRQPHADAGTKIGTRYVAGRASARSSIPNDPKDIEARPRAAGRDQGRAARRPGQLRDSRIGIRRARRRCATRCSRSARPFRTPRACSARRSKVDPVRHLIGSAIGLGRQPREGRALSQRHAGARTTARRSTSSTSRTCRSTASGRSASTTPRAISSRTRQTPIRSTTSPRRPARTARSPIQFGGCDGKIANCLPITPGWNYIVRLYRPRAEILDGVYTFPEAQPI